MRSWTEIVQEACRLAQLAIELDGYTPLLESAAAGTRDHLLALKVVLKTLLRAYWDDDSDVSADLFADIESQVQALSTRQDDVLLVALSLRLHDSSDSLHELLCCVLSIVYYLLDD